MFREEATNERERETRGERRRRRRERKAGPAVENL